MRAFRPVLVASGVASALALGLGTLPATASTPLQWNSPNRVMSGVPVPVSSIDACPLPPAGDIGLVQVTLEFQPGGAESQILDANPNGSWSGSVTFTFSGVSGNSRLVATCQNFNGVTGVVSARYAPHRVRIS
jgi:hypothetical protein